MYHLPQDPVMLLSFVNMKLRDEYPSLAEFCSAQELSEEELRTKLEAIDYHYIPSENQFK